MKPSIKVVLLLLVVGGAGILFGYGMRPAPEAAPAAMKPPATPEAMAAHEKMVSAQADATPRMTFIGPDGKARLIDYGRQDHAGKLPPPPSSREAVLQGIVSDLRHHPRLTGGNLGMTDAQIAEFLRAPSKVPPQVLAVLP